MAETPLARKLQIKPNFRVLLLGAPEGYRQMLDSEPLPDGARLADTSSGDGPYDVVQLFARTRDDVIRKLGAATDALKPGGVLWISWPKLSAKVETDLTRDVLWQLLESHGLRPVTAISIDETWSGLRFKPVEDVKSGHSGST